MKNMFQSATLKLTTWYLLIIMVVSVTFSAVIYQFAMSEFSARLDVVQSEVERSPRLNLPRNFFSEVRADQYDMATQSFLNGLFNVNLAILLSGGIGSYILARRTLRPIEEANLAQSQFVADASHQLRTPLAIMKAELETAQRETSLSRRETDELIDSTLEEVDKLSLLLHRLMELSKLDTESTVTKFEILSFSKLVEKSVTRHNKSHRRLSFDAPDTTMRIKASKNQIEEVIDILIDNAIKYSPSSSTIDMHLRKSGRYAHLSVTNAGKGIDKSDIEKVFDRFYRSRSVSASTGYGLGLAIAKKIVHAHSGELEVTSAPGKTTTFTVKLPLSD